MNLSKATKQTLYVILGYSFLFTLLITIKSLIDFSRTGPEVQQEISKNFSLYAVYALGRLSIWTFIISSYLTGIGALIYLSFILATKFQFRWYLALISGILSFSIISIFQFLNHLLHIPSSIISSWLYRNSRLYPIWGHLTPENILSVKYILIFFILIFVLFCFIKCINKNKIHSKIIVFIFVIISLPFILVSYLPSPIINKKNPQSASSNRPNILFIGSDTLRADHLYSHGYTRNLTPNIDSLAKSGTQFTNFFVPIARTAPSLTSFLTGSWPHTHGIRGNYNGDEKINLSVPSLPKILSKAGYHTEAIADWGGADLGKFNFGFTQTDTPNDQWNLKYLIRQGPKDLRLFLSLFTHNSFGKYFLPELYYLAGVPLTKETTEYSKYRISELSTQEQPFFLTIFTSTTHIPFGCEYPYYTLFSDPLYKGESKFLMSGLTTPSEIVKKQAQKRHLFDLQQVIDLYDGCIQSFDDSVGEIVQHLKTIGIYNNTIIMIFSDHGVDLFEKQSWGQGNSVLGDDPSARVPLIISHPSLPKNNVIANVTRSIDIVPTILDILDMPIPKMIDGVSLRPYIEKTDSNLHLTAFFETGVWLTPLATLNKNHMVYPSILDILNVPNIRSGTLAIKKEYENIVIEARDRMIRTDDWKLIYLPMKKGAKYWLFDIKNDPTAENDVSKKFPLVLKEMKKKLIDWIEQDPQRKWKNEHIVRL